MSIAKTLTDPSFIISLLVALAVFATLFTLPEYAALYRLFSMYGFEFVHEAIVSVFPGQRRA